MTKKWEQIKTRVKAEKIKDTHLKIIEYFV